VISKGELETMYRKESHAGLKERLLLVLKVEGDLQSITTLLLQNPDQNN
jgi:hypothetical protein